MANLKTKFTFSVKFLNSIVFLSVSIIIDFFILQRANHAFELFTIIINEKLSFYSDFEIINIDADLRDLVL